MIGNGHIERPRWAHSVTFFLGQCFSNLNPLPLRTCRSPSVTLVVNWSPGQARWPAAHGVEPGLKAFSWAFPSAAPGREGRDAGLAHTTALPAASSPTVRSPPIPALPLCCSWCCCWRPGPPARPFRRDPQVFLCRLDLPMAPKEPTAQA